VSRMVKGAVKKEDAEKTNVQEAPTFPIVALGSSAGGLEANEAFFKNAPPDSGMAYVVITHLEPHHPSLLVEIISRCTTMETLQAESEMVVQKNKIYIIPPGKGMMILDGKLHLFSREIGHEPFMPIDYFLRSLAEDRKDNAVAVILSGNGSDGSIGIKAVNANLGLVLVQKPDTAKYDSMPRSAIETGLVDYVVTAEDMPGTIMKYVHALGDRTRPTKLEQIGGFDSVQKILTTVKRETGHDFSYYKKSTINRRVERRMTVHQLENTEQYATYLSSNPKETKLLFKELLIEVTSFFRNQPAFESLKEVIRKYVMEAKADRDVMRVWVTACSTGEEAYSIGIILREVIEETGKHLQVQIFGSDINEDAINLARSGEYPLAIADDVNPKRLEKYFIKFENSYKLKKEVREMVIFAPHDVIQDPPFLHLDLLSCRNLLIYFEPVLQRRVLEVFSAALNSNGILFLGESETINGYHDRFTAIDPKWKIYQRGVSTPYQDMPRLGMSPRQNRERFRKDTETIKIPTISETVERILLKEHTPPSMIVNEKNEIVYFHGRNSRYLEHPQGKASFSIRDIIREDLRYLVTTAINEARGTGKKVVKNDIQVLPNGEASFLEITIKPVESVGRQSDVLVVFDEKTIPRSVLKGDQEVLITPNSEIRMDELEGELKFTKDSLQNTIEALETTNEELMSTNEELQSNNEELQSVVEESETGKEELNSLNEELLTVNSELERKNQELSTINSDLRNLLNSVDEAIIFLDMDLKIRRYTPQIGQIMNLLPGDVGRSISDIAMNIRYEDLMIDIRSVLDTLNTREKEVQTKEGHWFKLKILPYRTVENVIDGVVITFYDIDLQKKIMEKAGQ
jgi:two-component system, chemotaxis family, CheB/CheR fusion protein